MHQMSDLQESKSVTVHAGNAKTKNIIAYAVKSGNLSSKNIFKIHSIQAAFIGGICVLAFYMDHRTDGSARPKEHKTGDSSVLSIIKKTFLK